MKSPLFKQVFVICLMIQPFISIAQKPRILAPVQNVLFYNDDTVEITIEGYGIKAKKLVVKGNSHCTVKWVRDNIYSIIPKRYDNPDSTNLIYIGRKISGGVKWIDTIKVDIKKRFKPIVKFGKLESGAYTPEEILKQDRLICYDEYGYINKNWSLFSRLKMIIVTAKGFYEASSNGTVLSIEMKKMIAACEPGDFIFFDGIVSYSLMGERSESTLLFSVKQNETNIENFYEERITGYLRDSSGKQLRYFYPLVAGQKTMDERLLAMRKDSVWNYEIFSKEKQKFYNYRKDSFHNGQLIVSEYYRDSGFYLTYTIKKQTDSSYFFISYYSNGHTYQSGVVIKRSLYKRYHKSFYHKPYYQEIFDHWEQCIIDTPDDLFPLGKWNQYDSSGNLQMQVNYIIIPFDGVICFDDDDDFYAKDYNIVPDGKFTYYKNGKLTETIEFQKGEIISRKKER